MKNLTRMPMGIKPAHLGDDRHEYHHPFDNLEHIEALEYLAKLYLGASALRNRRSTSKESINSYEQLDFINTQFIPDQSGIDFKALSSKKPELSVILNHLSMVENYINTRVQHTLEKNVELLFETVCATYHLDNFERMCMVLLLAINTSKSFRDLYLRFGDDLHSDKIWGMNIGSLISIIEPEYKAQITSRKYFSIDAKLIKNNIIVTEGYYDKTSNIIDRTVYLHERIVRFILGDNNLYDNEFNCILKLKPSVKLGQVIIDEKLKKDVLNLSKNFLKNLQNNTSKKFEQFFGYGTGLAFLFYGLSGTGKTMLANALASELDMDLITVNFTKAHTNWHDREDIIAYVFKEAKLCNAIVFFDECSEIFEKGSSDSRSLLIEIEKSKCITILATNKVMELDPSLERRLTLKINFGLPNEHQREKIWKALIPPNIQIGQDVDFKYLSQKYIFTGGLIKNTIFTAITRDLSRNGNNKTLLTSKEIDHAAEYQSQSTFQELDLEVIYTPRKTIQQLRIKPQDKKRLSHTAVAAKKLTGMNEGLKVVLVTPDIRTGIECVEALGKELDYRIKLVDILPLLGSQKDNDVVPDFIKQHNHIFDYIFSNSIGQRSVILIKDRYGQFKDLTQKSKNEDQADNTGRDLINSIAHFNGLLFLVTNDLGKNHVPFEFHHYMSIQPPSAEDQIQKWETYLKNNESKENNIIEIVERFPMHLNEIEHVAEHAMIHACIERNSNDLTIEDVHDSIKKYKQLGNTPLLFGSERWA